MDGWLTRRLIMSGHRFFRARAEDTVTRRQLLASSHCPGRTSNASCIVRPGCASSSPAWYCPMIFFTSSLACGEGNEERRAGRAGGRGGRQVQPAEAEAQYQLGSAGDVVGGYTSPSPHPQAGRGAPHPPPPPLDPRTHPLDDLIDRRHRRVIGDGVADANAHAVVQ
eukprot:365435-Chlamydomonas_euryale.AAC.1